MTKILLVDGDKHLLLHSERELADDGYDVMMALNAREALSMLQSDHPELVVLDNSLPAIDGLEVLTHMLSMDRRVPIIFCSADYHHLDDFLCWSANAFIPKSSNLAGLKEAIRSLLSQRPALDASRTTSGGLKTRKKYGQAHSSNLAGNGSYPADIGRRIDAPTIGVSVSWKRRKAT